jgi:hypothetical protein
VKERVCAHWPEADVNQSVIMRLGVCESCARSPIVAVRSILVRERHAISWTFESLIDADGGISGGGLSCSRASRRMVSARVECRACERDPEVTCVITAPKSTKLKEDTIIP